MMARHVIGLVSELPPGERKIVEVEGRSIGVFNVHGAFYALRNSCPHQGGPLCLGRIKGMTLPSAPGEYVLRLAGDNGESKTSSTLTVKVELPPPATQLTPVVTKHHTITSPLWSARTRALIVSWIPHVIDMCERVAAPNERSDGGIDNFIEAGKALRGEPYAPHKGYVFSNAWVHQTVESMSLALMVDPQGDPEIIAAQ